jgi:hypothetical protein
MDFGFMCASTSDFSRPNKNTDHVVTSYDGFSSYLLIVDEANRFIWVFLTKSKAPPLDILDSFFACFGHEHGSSVRTDQGGELARSFALSDLLLRKHCYVMEPTGAGSPSQNGAVEIYNNKPLFALGPFSMALDSPPSTGHQRCNILSTSTTGSSTPSPRRLHSRHYMKELDRHDFKGIFLGYTATDNNIVYLDLNSLYPCTCRQSFCSRA